MEKILSMRPFTPPLEDMEPYLRRIWDSRWLTNGGSIHKELEVSLCDYLGIEYISLVSSGTLALILALKSLDLKGEIITTPFTSVATAQAIHWNGLKPVFVDINEEDLNINTEEIEKAFTPDTCAILPVHIYGNPCDTDKIGALAGKYQLKVIYDAAHCFGIKKNGTSLLNRGDLSTLSLHATKVFSCIEGGAVVCHDPDTKNLTDGLKNSGIGINRELTGFGLNAKMNEFQAAYGLVCLKYIDQIIGKRKTATIKYRELLSGIPGLRLITEPENVEPNYTYLPVLIDPDIFGATRDELARSLELDNIQAKTYFHPLVTSYPQFGRYVKRSLPVAGKTADNILCLPLFHDITDEEISRVVKVIKRSIK